MFGLGATYEDTGGSAPTKMQVGLSVNTAGDAAITSGETQPQVTALVQLGQGDEVNPKIFFTGNDGRALADENFFWAVWWHSRYSARANG